jgi:hypothetical protein
LFGLSGGRKPDPTIFWFDIWFENWFEMLLDIWLLSATAAVEDAVPMSPGTPDDTSEDHEGGDSKDNEANYLRDVLK